MENPEPGEDVLEVLEKHCKLLQVVSHSDRKLISDGDTILGIAEGPTPKLCLVAEFHGRIGLFRFNTTTRQAKLFEVEEALIEYEIDTSVGTQLFQIVTALVHNSQNNKHGCMIVLDLNPTPLHISGQPLFPPPLTSENPIFCNLS